LAERAHVLPQLIVLPNAAALALRTVELFISAASSAIASRGAFSVALAGGSTPKAAYELLAQSPYRERVDWPHVSVFFGDERCVPPTSDESNAKMAFSTLLDRVPIPATNIYRFQAEHEPERAASEYERTLVRELGPAPVLDLILLGMGPDGHTASLFPGTAVVHESGRLAMAPFVPKFNVHRLTLTPAAINAARRIVIAASGEGKADALAHAIEGPLMPNTYPVQVVAPTDGVLTWLVDHAAASQLTGKTDRVQRIDEG